MRLDLLTDASALRQALGTFAANQQLFSEAAEQYQKLADLEGKRGDEKGEAAAYQHLGAIALERRDFSAAEDCYQKALKIDEKLGNEHGVGSVCLRHRP
jgi:tetratricopeptide (TPR) repeat protein